MSARHSVKCTKEEAQAFRKKVAAFLKNEKLPYVKIVALRCYDGQVKVFTGATAQRFRQRMGRKLVAFKNPSGIYEGDPEAIAHLRKNGGDQCWETTNEPIVESESFPVYRADDWEDEKKYLKEALTCKAGVN